MVSLKDLESWKTLLNAAVIRNHEGILSIAKTLKEGEIPRISYHRKCRSIFTLKRDLKKLSQSVIQVEEQEDTSSRRSSIRQPVTTQSRVFERICVFCEKAKYLKGTKTREALIQCVDLRADSTIRRAAVGKNDPRILAIVTRELVAAEACYHKSCYRDYTRNVQGAVSSGDKKEEDDCPVKGISGRRLGPSPLIYQRICPMVLRIIITSITPGTYLHICMKCHIYQKSTRTSSNT